MYAVDASFDSLNATEAAQIKAAGVDFFIQCLWTGASRPSVAIANLKTAKAAGLRIAGYGSVVGGNSGTYHADRTRLNIPDDLWAALEFVATDVEEPIGGGTAASPWNVRDMVEGLKKYGKFGLIYTAAGFWRSTMKNNSSFTDCLLWNAFWDDDPDIDYAQYPYGGWTSAQVLIEQFKGGHNFHGVYVDRNVINPALLPGQEERVKYTDEVLDNVFGAILPKLGESLGIAKASAAAIINHVNTHPGGGSNQTMEAAIQKLAADLATLTEEYDTFVAAIAAASGGGNGQ